MTWTGTKKLTVVLMKWLYLPKDWRSHYQQMHAHSSGIASAMENTRSHLDKLHKEITKALEKIESREKYTNSQVSPNRTSWLPSGCGVLNEVIESQYSLNGAKWVGVTKFWLGSLVWAHHNIWVINGLSHH